MKKIEQRNRRRRGIRKKIFGKSKRPRLSVFRSNRYLYVQVVDDENHITKVGLSDYHLLKDPKSGSKSQRAEKLGQKLGKKLIDMEIKKIVFDRGGYRYLGRIKALAEGLRSVGIIF